jgi:uncharacterized protein (TIGR04222 family)
MFGSASEATWGIAGPDFLWGYGALCLIAAAAIWWQWSTLLGPRGDGQVEMDGQDLYELAMLSDGPQLAITSAAAQLHRDGLLRPGPGTGTLEVVGELPDDADPLERAVFEVVGREPGSAAYAMREQVAESEAVTTMVGELERGGLLLPDAPRTALARRMLLLGGLLAVLGIARTLAGVIGDEPVGYLAVMVFGVIATTIWAGGRLPVATARGRDVLEQWRDAHDDLRRHPVSGQSALTAALFGGAALWLAAPEIASALGVEREHAAGSGSGGGGGSCGGGGCGGGCGG